MLTDKLTIEQQNDILSPLFGLKFLECGKGYDGAPHWFLYDEEGYEFYGYSENLQFDFSTLAGIFSYAIHRSKRQGFSDCQSEIRKTLGI